MKPLPSLRSRLVVGSLLWTAGVLVITSAAAVTIVHRYPQWIRVIHNAILTIFAFGCVVAGLSLLRRGLSPFKQLRQRLLAVRDGRERRVEGRYPSEVQPLVDDLNGLLDDREQRVSRAIAKAGDLAHGLKTPLAVLSQEAARALAAGHAETAGIIEQQVVRMRGQIERHLANSRAAGSSASGARCLVRESVDGLVRTLERLYAERGFTFSVDVAADHVLRVQREDLDEILGNLLDNACKWARSRVAIASALSDAAVVVTVDDDGPGLDQSMRVAVMQRGVRADEAAPGSGFGLAIVRDLTEIYGGTIVLEASPMGGLRAKVHLPRG